MASKMELLFFPILGVKKVEPRFKWLILGYQLAEWAAQGLNLSCFNVLSPCLSFIPSPPSWTVPTKYSKSTSLDQVFYITDLIRENACKKEGAT